MSIVIQILHWLGAIIASFVAFGIVEYSLRYVTHDEVVRAILATSVAISTASALFPGGLGVCT